MHMEKKAYSQPNTECIELTFKAAICQMSGIGSEGTEDIELDDMEGWQ